MVVFARPDFGTSGALYLVVCFFFLLTLALSAIPLIAGFALYGRDSRAAKTLGIVLVLVGVAIPFLSWFGPRHVVRVVYGNYPLEGFPNGKVNKGMSQNDALAILGNPHQRFESYGEERWYYWLDSFGIEYFGVQFGPSA